MPDLPLVSVIIPAYNSVHYLLDSIGSVLEQTYPHFELIVVDDGSIDHPEEAVRSFNDPRLRTIHQENQGLAGARNSGLADARGRYVAFLDADDIFLPNKLEDQVGWFESHPDYGFVSGGWKYINTNGAILGSQQPWIGAPQLRVVDWLFSCPVISNSVLVEKVWIDQVGGFDRNFRRVEDWDLWLRLAYAGCRMGWVKAIVCAYRMSPDQMTRNAAEQKRVSARMMDKFFNQNHLPEEIMNLKASVYANFLILSAGRELAVEQCEDARESIREAIEFNPDLVDEKSDELIDKLLSWVDDPYVDDPFEYTRRVYDNLPAHVVLRGKDKHRALGEVGSRVFFNAYRKQNWVEVRRAAWMIALNAPHRMLNRGVWSILFQSVRS